MLSALAFFSLAAYARSRWQLQSRLDCIEQQSSFGSARCTTLQSEAQERTREQKQVNESLRAELERLQWTTCLMRDRIDQLSGSEHNELGTVRKVAAPAVDDTKP